MIKKNLLLINLIANTQNKFRLKIYSFGFIVLTFIETIGVGIVPLYFSTLLNKNLILEKLKFNDTLYSLSSNFLYNDNFIFLLSVFIIIFFVFKTLIMVLFHIFEAKLFNNLKINLGSDLFGIYLNKNYLFHTTNNPILLSRNITSEANNTVNYLKSLVIILKEFVQIFLITFLLLIVNFKITLILIIVLGIFSVIYLKIFVEPLKKKVEVSFFERGLKGKIINQVLNSIIEIKLYQKTSFFLNKLRNTLEREFGAAVFLDIIVKLPKLLIEIFIVLAFVFSVIYATTIDVKIDAVIALLGLYFFAALRIYPSVNNIITQKLFLVNGSVSANKIVDELLNSQNNENKIQSNLKKHNFKEAIKIKKLNFNYPNRDKVLHDINIEIKKNEIVGFIGETGSGKSTLIKLIMGLIDNKNGEILIDEIPIKEIRQQWQKNIGYIPQNYNLFDESILENIIFGEKKENIDLFKINNLTKNLYLDHFISNLPKKIETLIGPNAKKISGGQAQRIVIARALYNDPEIIILDEATNALDTDTEKKILDYFYSLKNKTIIIITHNKKILQNCDKIYQIVDGKIKIQ